MIVGPVGALHITCQAPLSLTERDTTRKKNLGAVEARVWHDCTVTSGLFATCLAFFLQLLPTINTAFKCGETPAHVT